MGAEPGKEIRAACVACGRGVWREWRVGAEPETGKETRVACVACGSGVRRVGVWARSQVRKVVWHAWRVGAACGVCAVWARSQKLRRRAPEPGWTPGQLPWSSDL